MKQVRQLVGVASSGDHCVLATRLNDEEVQGGGQGTFGLILCNALGTPVDSKYVDLEPRLVTVTASHVVTTSSDAFILWHYRTPRSQTNLDITGEFQATTTVILWFLDLRLVFFSRRYQAGEQGQGAPAGGLPDAGVAAVLGDGA